MRPLLALLFACASAVSQQSPQAFTAGNGVTSPRVVAKVDPQYSEEARLANLNGTIQIRMVVSAEGKVLAPEIVKPLGLGLDEKAIEAVNAWRFQPGMKDGMPVPVFVTVELNFGLVAKWRLTGVAFQTPERAQRPILIMASYPSSDTPAHETGSASISFDVSREGIPENLHIEKSSNRALESPAIAMAKDWRFRPATRDGDPIPVRCTLDLVLGR